jgi:hypothetical protein
MFLTLIVSSEVSRPGCRDRLMEKLIDRSFMSRILPHLDKAQKQAS